jgi:hypothetical protein
MLMVRRYTVVAGLALLAGCSGMNFNTVQKTNQLTVGMTDAEVMAVLGRQPDSRTVKDGRTVLRFTLQEPWKGYVPYDMVFDGQGKLESWKADEEAYQRNQQALAQTAKNLETQGPSSGSPAGQTGQTGQQQPGSAPAPAGPNDPELQRWIAGKYMSYVGQTYRQLILSPGGTFRYHRESSYSGREKEVGGVWGQVNETNNSGTWTISGSQEAGQISLLYGNGNRQNMNYRRGRERGVFIIDGTTYAYEGAAD